MTTYAPELPAVAAPIAVGALTLGPQREPILTHAELAECTCPDACERDHEFD